MEKRDNTSPSQASPSPASPSLADDVVGELLPEGFDWVRIVRTYPMPCLVLAAAAGFFLGRRHGTQIMDSLSNFASEHMNRSVNQFLDITGEANPDSS